MQRASFDGRKIDYPKQKLEPFEKALNTVQNSPKFNNWKIDSIN